MRAYVSFSGIFGALLAALIWILAALILIVHSDALIWDIAKICAHLLNQYTLLLLGLLVLVDIALDVYVLKSHDNFFARFPNLAWKFGCGIGVVVFVLSVVASMMREKYPDFAVLSAVLALSLLFLLRFFSYIRFQELVAPPAPSKPVAEGRG